MVRYPFDVLRAVSKVEPLTMNGKSGTYECCQAFALRYRATFYGSIKIGIPIDPSTVFNVVLQERRRKSRLSNGSGSTLGSDFLAVGRFSFELKGVKHGRD
jgi:hypothetical protein